MIVWWQAYDAILFDLDGTLIDSSQDLTVCFNDILKQHGFLEMPEHLLRVAAGMGSAAMMQVTENHLGTIFTPQQKEVIKQDFFSHYQNNLLRYTASYAGAETLLQALKKAGKMVVLATNKPSFLTIPTIQGLKLDVYFDKVVCSDQVSKPKPHPHHLLESLPKNIDLSTCAMVGDTYADYEAAIACPMNIYMVNHALETKELFPKAVFLKDWH